MNNSTIRPKPCSECSSPYHSAMYHKPRKPIVSKVQKSNVRTLPKRSKRPKQIGKGTLQYNEWRDTIARPYLIATYGERCVIPGCSETQSLDVDHIENRGSHPELKMTLSNVQLMCRPHHREKTDHVSPDTKKEDV